MNHYADILKELCAKLAAERDGERTKVLEMEIACAVMLANGYVFNPHRGIYERG